MRKFISAVLFSLLTICLVLPCTTEAASAVILPLINNVADRDDLGQIYYDRAIEAMKKANGVELADDTKVDQAIAKYSKVGVLPDQAALEGIAREANVEYVLAMQVDKLVREDITMDNHGDNELTLQCEGNAIAYNATTGKIIKYEIYDRDRQELSQGARYDVEGEMFANNVTRFVKRALGVKKITIERPRISKDGFKGNR